MKYTGPLFFGSVSTFLEKFDVPNDPAEVIIDFKESRITDMSAIEALNKLTERYNKAGKKLHLRHLKRRLPRINQERRIGNRCECDRRSGVQSNGRLIHEFLVT